VSSAPGNVLLGDIVSEWRSAAKLFREHEQPATAVAYEKCATTLEEALNQENEVTLSLLEASARSGYSANHLGRMVREGKIPNAGRPRAPRIAQKDLPRKLDIAPSSSRGHLDRTQIVRSVVTLKGGSDG
jgi:hypothetical protein